MLFTSSDILLMVYYSIVMLDLGFPGGAYHVLNATQQTGQHNKLIIPNAYVL